MTGKSLRQAAVAAALAALAACSSTDKQCADFCGTGNACVDGTCVPIACSPACGAGTACQMGQCVAVAAVTCSGTAGACQVCDTSRATPAWVGVCGPGSVCDAGTNTCVLVSQQIHAEIPALAATFQNGWQVSAACVGCHPQQATDLMQTAHWNWYGPTPDLMTGADPYTATTASYGVAIGKRNLVNNFCVSTVSNEKRCEQCHAGYGGDPLASRVQQSARAYATVDTDPGSTASTASSIPLEQRVDCLVCHADLAASRYAKAQANFGAADVKPAAGCAAPGLPPGVDGCASGFTCLLDPQGAPSCVSMAGTYYKAKLAETLGAAARSVRTPDRDNCGTCHFYAGGGDAVKLMGSALSRPSRSTDVHMGGGMTCADCHAQPGHRFSGAGIHVPAHTERSSCEDCHGTAPHASATFNTHARKIACQTCHIPRFARAQFAKVDWDWSVAGQKDVGVVKETLTDGAVTSKVETYSYLKGKFTWKANIVPAYRWYDGRMTHATLLDKAFFDAAGTTSTARITLGEPVGDRCSPGSKIHPFKLMHGRQAVYVDPASTAADPRDFVVNPNVFGPGSLWGVLQSPAWTAASYGTPGKMDDLWTQVLTNGARAAGQIGPTDTLAKASAGVAGWEFRTTRLYMDLNHEVAPKEQALGYGSSCATCHGAAPAIPFQELGYTVPLPMAPSCP